MAMEKKTIKIKVIGVGGCGISMVSRMIGSGATGVELIAVDTDRQALDRSGAQRKIQIGEQVTYGLDADSDPRVGRRSAEESLLRITEVLVDADMVFIAAGMGGGTGTGATPVVAEAAKSQGILTVGIVTKPFGFEGRHRMEQAKAGIGALYAKMDSLLVIPNDRIRYAAEQEPAFMHAGDVLRQSVLSIADIVRQTDFINLDFDDVTAVMKRAGPAYMGVGRASGEDRAAKAVRMAVSCPLLETSFTGARAVLIDIVCPADMDLEEVTYAAGMAQALIRPDADMIFGAAFDNSLDGEIRVNVIATGFGEKQDAVRPSGNVVTFPVEPASDMDDYFEDIRKLFDNR